MSTGTLKIYALNDTPNLNQMTNYSVTIGYRAVISISVKACSKEDAEAKAIEIFRKQEEKIHKGRRDVCIEHSRFAADGILDMDETWNSI